MLVAVVLALVDETELLKVVETEDSVVEEVSVVLSEVLESVELDELDELVVEVVELLRNCFGTRRPLGARPGACG